MLKAAIKEVLEIKESNLFYPFEQEADLLQAIIICDRHRALLSAECFLYELVKRYKSQELHYIKSCVLHLTVVLVRNCFQMGFKVEKLFNLGMEHAETLKRACSVQEIRLFLQDLIGELLLIEAKKRRADKYKYEIIVKAKAYIDGNFQRTITLEEVAGIVHLSPCYFSRLFSEVSGYTFQEYLTKVRINAAQKLLLDNKLSLEEVAELLGYNDVSYFIRVFKKVVGLTPRQFAKGFSA